MPASRTRTTGPKGHKKDNPGAVLPLRWSATEYAPRKRWWWFVILAYVVLTLSLLLALQGNWSAALLTLVVGLVLFVMYLAKPRVWDYTLRKDQLEIRSGSHHLEVDLTQYSGVVLEELPRRLELSPFRLLVLLPKRRLQSAKDIYLTGEPDIDGRIADALQTRLPQATRSGYSTAMRLLDRAARVLRLN